MLTRRPYFIPSPAITASVVGSHIRFISFEFSVATVSILLPFIIKPREPNMRSFASLYDPIILACLCPSTIGAPHIEHSQIQSTNGFKNDSQHLTDVIFGLNGTITLKGNTSAFSSVILDYGHNVEFCISTFRFCETALRTTLRSVRARRRVGHRHGARAFSRIFLDPQFGRAFPLPHSRSLDCAGCNVLRVLPRTQTTSIRGDTRQTPRHLRPGTRAVY